MERSFASAKTCLYRAERLTIMLSREERRWGSSIDQTKTDIENVLGNALISAAVIIYLGPFDSEFRKEMI